MLTSSPPRVTSLLLPLVLAATGCSFKLVRPSPPRSDWPEPVTSHSSQSKCTTTIAPPVLDTTVGVGFGALAYVERDARSQWFSPVVAASAIPFLASALYGYFMVERCRDYEDHFANVQPETTNGAPP